MKKIFIALILLITFSTAGYGFNLEGIGRLNLPQVNEPATPTLNFGDGDSGLYESTDDALRIVLNSATKFYQFDIDYFSGYFGTNWGVGLRNVAATATLPNVLPSLADENTGIGTAGADILSLIAGGVEGMRITEVAGLITNALPGIVKTPTTQTLTTAAGAGAIDIITAITHIVSTGVDALSLADGAEGQWKSIVMKTDGGAATLTPTNPGNFATLTFDDVGDSALLIFTNGKWIWMGGTATKA